MNNPKQILWTDLNSAPPKNYLWQKKDGIYETEIEGNTYYEYNPNGGNN